MINPADILAAANAAAAMGQSSAASMSSPFIQAIPSMSVGGPQNASQIMNGIHESGSKLWAEMGVLSKSMNDQVAAHQEKQRSEKPHDFKPDMSDLRPSDAKGFPKEMASDFFAPFMK